MDLETEPNLLSMLVVHDEPSIADAISMTVSHRGCRVETTETGRDALDMAQRWRPNAMVLDVTACGAAHACTKLHPELSARIPPRVLASKPLRAWSGGRSAAVPW